MVAESADSKKSKEHNWKKKKDKSVGVKKQCLVQSSKFYANLLKISIFLFAYWFDSDSAKLSIRWSKVHRDFSLKYLSIVSWVPLEYP
jgi:hypothetical protein